MRHWLAFALPLLVACSSNNSDGAASADAGPDTAIDASAICSKFAAAYCGKFAACADFFVRFAFGDAAGCEKRVVPRCKMWLTSPGMSGAVAGVEACTAGVPSAACPTLLTGTACALPSGTHEIGAGCGSDEQCKSGFCSLGTDGCGKCAAPPADGAPCLSGQCGLQRRCAAGTCLTPRAQGAACTQTAECALPLSCFDGRCSSPAPLDAACSTEGKGAPDCDFTRGHVCIANTCIAAGLAPAGATCGLEPPMKLTLCLAGGTCQSGTSPTGTCLAAANDGEPCDEMLGPRCLSGSRCVAGVCRIPDAGACR